LSELRVVDHLDEHRLPVIGIVGVVYIDLRTCVVNTRAQSGEGIVSRSPPTPTSVPPAMAACSSSVLGTSIAGVMTASLRIPAFLSIRRGPWAMWESSFCCKLVLQPSDRAPSIRFGDISARFLDRLIYSVAIQSATSTQGTVLGCRSGAEQAGRSHLRQTTSLSRLLILSHFFEDCFHRSLLSPSSSVGRAVVSFCAPCRRMR
jgi:hypothetical protein